MSDYYRFSFGGYELDTLVLADGRVYGLRKLHKNWDSILTFPSSLQGLSGLPSFCERKPTGNYD